MTEIQLRQQVPDQAEGVPLKQLAQEADIKTRKAS